MKKSSNVTENKKNILIIELSEFNVELLTKATNLYSLPYLHALLQFKKSSYKTNDRYNSGYLTPAIQWRSIHLGKSAKIHTKITKLNPETSPYIWDTLEKHKINGLYHTHDRTDFDNKANNLSRLPTFSKRIKTIIYFLKKAYSLGNTLLILKIIVGFRLKTHKKMNLLARYIIWLEYVSALLFCKQKQKQQPRCSILLLNALAYCQCFYWKETASTLSEELVYSLETLDKIIGALINTFPNDSIIIHNGLSHIKADYTQADNNSGKVMNFTSRVIPMGTIFSQDIKFPNHIFNYEVNQYIYNYFLPEEYTLKSEYIEDEISLTTTD